jgi:MFS transporter, DHA1 family, multidrug resistance protein
MKQHILPATWLILFIVGLPIFSETVYTPSLPDIAQALSVRDALVEYTLTIYLFGLAVGTLLWGNLSDKWGRKPCLIFGFSIYLIGCIGCYLSDSITWLLIARFVQALGGSGGSVLGQAICRDAFHGSALGKMYATVGSALAIFPAIGPIIGGVIDQHYGWSMIFLFLILFGSILIGLIGWHLPETHLTESREKVSMLHTLYRMSKDRHVIGCGLLVGTANGIQFSYYAEGPFFMIELLGLTPSQYGVTFIGIASAMFIGGLVVRKLHNFYDGRKILAMGLVLLILGSIQFVSVVSFTTNREIILCGTLAAMFIIKGGIIMVNANALSLALVEYKKCVGTASSLFGFAYYLVISLITYGMGFLHNDTLFPMPIYFCALAVFMVLINQTLLRQTK